jgi:hypothetical protein
VLPATISVRQAGRLLGVCTASAYEAARTGQLPVLRLGPRRMLVPTARLREMLGCTAGELAHQIAAVEAEAAPDEVV